MAPILNRMTAPVMKYDAVVKFVLNRGHVQNRLKILGLLAIGFAHGCFFDGEGQPMQAATHADILNAGDAVDSQIAMPDSGGDVGSPDAPDIATFVGGDSLSNAPDIAAIVDDGGADAQSTADATAADVGLAPACQCHSVKGNPF